MASVYKKGDVVKTIAVIPTGPIESIRMRDDGMVMYLVTYTDVKGVEQQRWFGEDQLTLA